MKGILTIIVSLLCSVAMADNVLVINFTSGATQLYDLYETIKVQSQNDTLFVTSKSISAAYASRIVSNYKFTYDVKMPTAINEATVAGSSITFKRDGQKLIVSGIDGSARVRVYSTNGMQQGAAVSYVSGSAVIDFSALTNGVYIVQLTGCKDAPSMKFIKD